MTDLVEQMNPEQLRRTLANMAFEIAVARYQRRLPTCDPEDAIVHATAHWQEFQDEAETFLAMLVAKREKTG
jgi:hypothetical protein